MIKDVTAWIKLAEAYIDDQMFIDELHNAKCNVYKKHKFDTDFVGYDLPETRLMNVVMELLGEEFEYFFFECECSYRIYNENIINPDGSHPKCKTLEDLFNESMEYSDET